MVPRTLVIFSKPASAPSSRSTMLASPAHMRRVGSGRLFLRFAVPVLGQFDDRVRIRAVKSRTLMLFASYVFAFITIAGVEASAHSFPQEQSPTAGQTLAAAPSDVSIKYDAPIEHLFAKLEVVDYSGSNVAAQPDVSPDGRTLSTKVNSLKPGEYTVKWSVVCIDTHHTQGSYTFSVSGTDS